MNKGALYKSRHKLIWCFRPPPDGEPTTEEDADDEDYNVDLPGAFDPSRDPTHDLAPNVEETEARVDKAADTGTR